MATSARQLAVAGPPYGGDRDRRPTYSQDWPNYKLAREYEKEFFLMLLSDLMDLVREPDYSFGRPSHKISDVLKVMAIKVYGGKSAQRSKGDFREAHRLGYLSRVPASNTLLEYFGQPELTPVLHECIEFTAMVLSRYESDFSVDSSGFRTTNHMRWFQEKHGKKARQDSEDEDQQEWVERKSREWLKVHIVVGTNTQIVTGVRVLGWRSSDYEQFVPLFQRVHELFNMLTITADGAYVGRNNFEATDRWGSTLYTPFHGKHVRPPESDQSAWATAYRLYYDNFDDWFPLYHRRSLVETAYSTIKRLFTETIRSEKPVAQINEMLLKVLCHNIVVIIHEMFEMDVHPFFASADSRLLRSLPEEALPLFLRDGYRPAPQWPENHQFRHIGRPACNGHGSVFHLPHHLLDDSGW